MIPYSYVVYLTSLLFGIAVYGILSKRNVVMLVVGAEIIINAALINLVAASSVFGNLAGSSYALLIVVIAVLETAAIVAMAIVFYSKTGSISLGDLKEIKG